MNQTGIPKLIALQNNLWKISPFINIEFCSAISKKLDPISVGQTEEYLNKFDFIFDCTSDNELSYVLDSLSLKSSIINISISNKAKEMVCVTGSNICHTKNVIFSNLNTLEEISFYEGTGCWSPTFEASFFDINSLLNQCMKNINYKLENSGIINSFIVKEEIINESINLRTIDY